MPLKRPKSVRDKRLVLTRPFIPQRLGEGREGLVVKEDIQLLWKGKSKPKQSVAVKYPTKVGKPSMWARYPGEFVSPEQYRKRLVGNRQVWQALKNAGLPVPEVFRPMLRRNSKLYLATIMEELKSKYGSLIKVHESHFGVPVLLSKLTVEKDVELIKELGRDLATIHSLGFFPRFADFWELYKIPKTNTYGRVIVDFSRLHEKRLKPSVSTGILMDSIRSALGWKEHTYFIAAYKYHLREIGKEEYVDQIVSQPSQ